MPYEAKNTKYYCDVIGSNHIMVTDRKTIQELLPEGLKGVKLYKTVFYKTVNGEITEVWGSEDAVVYSHSLVFKIR